MFVSPFAAVLIGSAPDAERAISLAGGRIAAQGGWDDALTAGAVLVIEAEGVADTVLDDALPRLAADAEAAGMPIVATIAIGQIDLAAASLMGSRTALLVAPTLAERVAALALAAAGHGSGVREDEADRFRRLNDEIARLTAMLAQIGERAAPGDSVDDRRMQFGVQPGPAPMGAAQVRRVIRARRLRTQFFDARLVEDPGWDMLLDLFAASLEGVQVSVSSLCIAAAVAPTTALRWITRMVDAGLLTRAADSEDRRRAFLTLTIAAEAGMRAYAGAVQRAGLNLV
ncbi:MAG TPA: hypothetical protein VFQ57_01275 [Sphingomonas sp.]|jgi:hypothetical protein|nr:hypothetical protein [Sphingomonas sp.]